MAAEVAPEDTPAPWRRALLAAALIPLGWGALRLAALRPDWVERAYSSTAFPAIRTLLRAVSGILPIHLAELLLMGLAVSLLVSCRRAFSSWWRKRRSARNLLQHGSARLLRASGWLYGLFLLTWGFNHARQPYAVHVGLELSEVSSGELAEVLTWLVQESNRLRAEFDGKQWDVSTDHQGSDPRIARAYEALGREVPVLAGGQPLLRRAWLSPVLSRLGISGIYSPFTAESHVNVSAKTYFLPFSAAHEIAHFKGFAREDEANFIAWQVCRRSEDPLLRYSGTLTAMSFTSAALARTDWFSALAIRGGLDPAVLDDLDISRTYWESKRSVVTEVAEASNDVYLKSQGQPEGRRSYGRMVDLIVAEWRASRGTSGAISD